MIFQEYVDSSDFKKIERYLLFLVFTSPSCDDSEIKVYKKDNISITIRCIDAKKTKEENI